MRVRMDFGELPSGLSLRVEDSRAEAWEKTMGAAAFGGGL